jgi:multiple sugar transport system substrate-binding protein
MSRSRREAACPGRGMTRRRVSHAFGLGAAAAVLGACGGAQQSSAPAPAPAATGAPGGEVSVLYYTSTEPAIKRMEKQEADIGRLLPQIKLSMIPTPTAIYDKYATMAAGGTPPDLAWMGTGFWQFAPYGHFTALDDLVARDKDFRLQDYYPEAVNNVRYKGRLLALPYGLDVDPIVYNRGMFDKAGVRYPTKDWTIADYVDVAKRLTSAPGEEPQAWGGWINNLQIAIWMHGGEIFDKGFTRSLIDQPPAVSGLQFFYDQNLGSLKIAPQTGNATQLFGNGQLAMMWAGPFLVPSLRQYQGLAWDAITMPWTAEKKPGSTWMSVETYAMSSGTKNKDGAWAVLKYLAGREAMASLYAPEFIALPAIRSIAETTFVTALPGVNARVFLDSIATATPYAGHPVVMKMGEVLTPMRNDVLEQRKSARDAAQEAAVKLNELLKQTPA